MLKARTGLAVRSAAALAVALAGCTSTADTYPVNQAAFATGLIKVEFTRYGTEHGPITATLPDGSVLKGHYSVTDGDSFAVLSGRFGVTSAFAESGGRPVEADATNGVATIQCALRVNLGGHGGGLCELDPKGAVYRVTF